MKTTRPSSSENSLYKFSGQDGAFHVPSTASLPPVYFPLVNDLGLLSAITPTLHGDIKIDQHTFLTPPVSIEDLHLSLTSRNFWITLHLPKKNSVLWSVSGQSVWQKADTWKEDSHMDAGFLWQETTRTNKSLGLEARVLNFVPPNRGTFEVMYVEIKNISKKKLTVTPTSAIPLYGRSADNLRDHRHVTSLLNRMEKDTYGVRLTPTMSFNERGHLINQTSYYVWGVTDKGQKPTGFFPTLASFVGIGGGLDKPLSLVNSYKPFVRMENEFQGKEAMGALQFPTRRLAPGERYGVCLFLGIQSEPQSKNNFVSSFIGRKKVLKQLKETQDYWRDRLSKITFRTGDETFNQWVRWVQLQPILRRIYGCSFLPDFDYGRGGRGWRDLWQDCLALILASPEDVRDDIVRNYGGVRIDGSNATIITRKKQILGNGKFKWIPEFVADRNNIVRTWMDHGIWPFLTTLLYFHQTGDGQIFFEKIPYFRDSHIYRGKKIDDQWTRIPQQNETKNKLATRNGNVYESSVLEHILVQTLVPFFNVGEHNTIRLEDADWNDGLDMAHHRGESVAFTSQYAGNLDLLANLMETLEEKTNLKKIEVFSELELLLDQLSQPLDYDRVDPKQKRLQDYFASVSSGLSGKTATLSLKDLAKDLRSKSAWIKNWINNKEWLTVNGNSWFNGYYDDTGTRVEGKDDLGHIQMTLTGQVYPIMAGVASPERIKKIINSVNTHLFDERLGGIRLNTSFGSLQPHLGRAFSFAFGEKENGAVFSHMAVMYAYALYSQGFSREGHQALQCLYQMAIDSSSSHIFPGLPEYFNNEGRGRYAYLTGSASWYILTLLTQSFGVRGEAGDLLISPKLVAEQFDKSGAASVQIYFAGSLVRIQYQLEEKYLKGTPVIHSIQDQKGRSIPLLRQNTTEVLISRDSIRSQKSWHIVVKLKNSI
jgi:cellobiose phosphorylase